MKTFIVHVLIRPDPDHFGPDDRSSEGVVELKVRALNGEQTRRDVVHLVLSRRCLVSEFLEIVEVEKKETER